MQDKDIEAVTRLADVEGDEEQPLDDDWDQYVNNNSLIILPMDIRNTRDKYVPGDTHVPL